MLKSTKFNILNYVRSAFTYIDEEQPSCQDSGKHKFGGPFTEKEMLKQYFVSYH